MIISDFIIELSKSIGEMEKTIEDHKNTSTGSDSDTGFINGYEAAHKKIAYDIFVLSTKVLIDAVEENMK